MALLLDLTQLRGPREHIERSYPAEALDIPDEDFQILGDTLLVFDIERQDRRYRLVGRVTAELELRCSRCLEPMRLPVDAPFDVRYLPASVNTGEDEAEVAEEDLGVAFYEAETIDLGQLVREQLYLSLPMKPLCRAECEGLCPECGANLNVAPCGCEHRWVDPRMAALEALLPKKPQDD
jgi:uncharacterized protein